MRKLVFLVVFLVGCSGSAEGPTFTFADLTSPSTPATVLDSDASLPTSSTTTTSTVPDTTTTTLAVVDSPVPLLVRRTDGVAIVDQTGAERQLLAEPVGQIFDDLQGGFVLQRPGAGSDPEADQRIFWSRATNADAQPFLDVAPGELLQVWGVEEFAEGPAMILTVSGEAGAIQELIVFDFETGDRVLAEWNEASALSISYSGDRFLIEARRGADRFFEFRNAQGAVLALEYNPLPGCIDDSTCPRNPRIASSGGSVAYLETDFEAGKAQTDVVVYDLENGVESVRIPIPAGATSLDFDGDIVLVNRTLASAPLLVDVENRTVSMLDGSAEVSFLRREPAFEGQFSIVN